MFLPFFLCRLYSKQWQVIPQSIPNTPRPVMRQNLFPLFLELFHRIIQIKVNQDGVDVRLRMLSFDVPSDQLDRPDAASPQLHLPLRSAWEDLLVFDRGCNRWAAVQSTKSDEDLWNTIVGKHSDLVNVIEVAIRISFEASPNVRDEDLGSFEETHRIFATLVQVLIAKTLEVLSENVDETGR